MPTRAPDDYLTTVGITDPALVAAIGTGLREVEERLAEAVASTDQLAAAAGGHLVAAGGKRTRPLLCLLAAQLGEPTPAVLEAAVVVELTHLATLYHDDVIDSAPTRRGVPAAQEVWGNTVAILIGDLLFARASRVCAGLGNEAVDIQAATFERLVLGELHETAGPRPGQDAVEHYLQVLSDKTGSLIATAARFGGMFAGVDRPVLEALMLYGERVGIAFQLADDVLDFAGDQAVSGKTPGTDLREGVPTMPVLLARRALTTGVDPIDTRRLLALVDGDLSDDAALAEAVAAMRAHPALEEARLAAQGWARAAVKALSPLPPGPARDSLAAVAEAFADRAR